MSPPPPQTKADRILWHKREWLRFLDRAFVDRNSCPKDRVRCDQYESVIRHVPRIQEALDRLRATHGDLALPPPKYLPLSIRMCRALHDYLRLWAEARAAMGTCGGKQ